MIAVIQIHDRTTQTDMKKVDDPVNQEIKVTIVISARINPLQAPLQTGTDRIFQLALVSGVDMQDNSQ